MNKQLYIRSGRRFVSIPNVMNHFVNKDGSFTKERTPNSFAYIVKQEGANVLAHRLELEQDLFDWDYANKHYRLPTRAEAFLINIGLIAASNTNNLVSGYTWTDIWTKDVVGFWGAWYLTLDFLGFFGYCRYETNTNRYCVLAFIDYELYVDKDNNWKLRSLPSLL